MKNLNNVLSGLVLICLSTVLTAEGIVPQMNVPAGPEQVLQRGVEILQGMLAEGERIDQAQLESFVNNQVSPLFDFEEMARFAGGPYYRNFNDAEKKKFRDQLETMFLTAMIQQLAIFNASAQPQVKIFPMRFRSPTQAEAFARVVLPDGKMKKLRFLMYRGSQGWKIVDVSSNGKSAIIYYRNFFFREARANGPAALLNLFGS